MARVQVNEAAVPNAVQFNPPKRDVFTPVDTMNTAPAPPAQADFYRLANSLKEMNPDIEQFLGKVQKGYTETEAENAKAAALKSGLSYGEAVRQGVVSPDQSPWFMRAWRELDGQNKADAVSQAIQQKYATDPIRNSTDPKAIQDWLTNELHGATQGITDGDELAGATPKLLTFQQSILKQQTAQASANATYGLTTAAGTQVGNIVDQYVAEMKNNGRPFNAAELSGLIHGPAGMAKFVGLDPKDTDTVLMESVIAKAKQYADPELLQALTVSRPDARDPTKLIPGAGTSAVGQGHLVAAQKEIMNEKLHLQNAAFEAEQHKRTLEIQQLNGAVFVPLMHGQQPNQAQVDRLVTLDGAAAEKLQSFRLNQLRLAEHTDPVTFARQLDSYAAPDASGRTAVQRFTSDIVAGKVHMDGGQVLTTFNHLRSIDDSGVVAMKPVAEILSAIDKDGTDPNNKVIPMFTDIDAKTAVKARIVADARDIVLKNPGVDPQTLYPQFLEARDRAIDDYKKLYPSKINLSGDEKSHSAGLPGSGAAPKPPKAEAPEERPDQALPSPFSKAPPEAAAELKAHLTDAAYVKRFKAQYGVREYERIKKEIR